jgi:hypothetical protein
MSSDLTTGVAPVMALNGRVIITAVLASILLAGLIAGDHGTAAPLVVDLGSQIWNEV